MNNDFWKEILDSEESIFENFNPEAIAVFEFLAQRAKSKSHRITTDRLFQFVFKKFYGMDRAFLSPEFNKVYFEIFEETKHQQTIVLKNIAFRLSEIENLQGQKPIQISFITKMANCLDQNFPIYDSNVCKAFGFKRPRTKFPFDQRIRLYCDDCERIRKEYENVLKEKDIEKMSQRFRKEFNVPKIIEEKRILDFIVWTYAGEELT